MFRTVLTAVSFLLVLAPAAAQEKFPSRPIELIIHYAPGGGTDIVMRQLAPVLEQILGQKIVIVNKPGAGGLLGVAAVTQAKPDGYTLGGVANAPLTMVPHIQAAPYAPTDYVPVSVVDTMPAVLCVKPAFPAKNPTELVAHLKANPNKYTYGNDGVGAIIQLSFERVFLKMGIKARPVPFAGAGETLKNFLGGHVDIFGGSPTTILPHMKDGSAKCLLVTGPDHIASLPDAASLTDLGIPDASTLMWHGVIAPKGIAPDRLAFLEKAFQQAARSPAIREYMESRGLKVEASTSAEFRRLIDTEYAAMGQVVKAIGLAK